MEPVEAWPMSRHERAEMVQEILFDAMSEFGGMECTDESECFGCSLYNICDQLLDLLSDVRPLLGLPRRYEE